MYKLNKYWMKKLALLFITLCMAASSWAYSFKSGSVFYSITSSTPPYTVTVSDSVVPVASYSGAVTIPSSVTYNNITYAVTSIGSCAFFDCSGVTSVSIPTSVTSIGSNAFYSCSALTSIVITSVTSIGDNAFAGCSALTSVTLPSSLTYIGNDAFYYCKSLTSISIPSAVTSVGESAFSSCSGLTSITILNSTTSFGEGAFGYCTSLTNIYNYQTTPMSLCSYSLLFYNLDTTKCTLHVPIGSLVAYQNAYTWKGFKTILADLGTTTGIASTQASTAKIYVIDGQAVIKDLQAGQNISVCNLQGSTIYRGKATSETVSIPLPSHGVYVVVAGQLRTKIIY